MLYDVRIIEGQEAPIAAVGKNINVVLAAGDIEVRILLSNDSTFRTKLVSGMSFEVPRGFKSVSFSAESSQQAKVWLSDLPLNYTPLELKTVGASALSQSVKNVFYGGLTEITPSKIGRGKVTIQANKDFKIGGIGSTLNNTISIAAGEKFSLSTQSAIFGHSLDKDDIPIEISKFTLPLVENRVSVGAHGTNLAVYFNHVLGELIVLRSFNIGLYRMNQEMTAFIGAVTGGSNIKIYSGTEKIVGDTLVMFGIVGSELVERTYSLADYSYTDLSIGVTGITSKGPSDFGVSNFLVSYGPNSGDTLVYGNYIDGQTNIVDLSTLPFSSKVVRSAFMNKDGDIFVLSYDGLAVTSDFGVTWTTNPHFSSGAPHMVNDIDGGRIYAVVASQIVYSDNGGYSFDKLLITPTAGGVIRAISSLVGNGGYLIALTDHGILYYDKGADEWHTFDTRVINGGNGSPTAFSVAGNGKMYLTSSTSPSIMEFAGEVDVIGGLSVSIMEEVN